MMCPKTNRHISVPERHRQLMEERSFVVFEVNHFTTLSESELPQAAETAPVAPPSDDAPTELTLPTVAELDKKLPRLYQANRDESVATQLVRAFEEKVVVQDSRGNTKVVYSPYRLWTKELAKVDPPAFTNRCKAYYAFMKLLQESEGSPADIKESQNSLTKKGTNMKKPEQARDWFEAAKSACRIRD